MPSRPHRPSRLRALALVFLTLPLVLGALLAVPAASADELADALARKKALQARIADQKAALAELKAAEARLRTALSKTATALSDIRADQTAIRKEIAEATAALAAVEKRYAQLVAELAHLDWTLGLLEDEVAQTERDLESRRRLLAQRLSEAYKAQQTSLLEQILVADSFADVLAEVGTHLRFGDRDAQLAAQIERDQKNLDSLRRTTSSTRFKTEQVRQEVQRQAVAIRDQRARLLVAKKQLDRLEAETKRLQAEQLAAFRRVNRSKAAAAAALRAQVRAQNSLSREIARIIEQQRRRGNIPSIFNGTFIWPMNGRISQDYGCTGFAWEPPYGDCAHFHKGIDLVAPAGEPIRAAGAGVVVFVGYNPYDPPSDPAWIVIVAHSNNLQTWYAHMQPRYPPGIYAGASVKQGQVVGYEGNTGNSTGAHLHWAVMYNDTFVNPRLFL
ncbi:MAG TPA: peptidoglycan DD-metalloendopeptidase family protein [Candidatus Limnocylindrales bacterium]|nr:peptidoglycan DD-metalloendopeptidase family protein [Candidatus Limnocylindrales bacterium]